MPKRVVSETIHAKGYDISIYIRDLLNQTMMSNQWDAAFSRFVSCPND